MPKIVAGKHNPIEGTPGSDTIDGGNGADLIYGDGLNGPRPALPGENTSDHPVNSANVINGGNGSDTVFGGYGTDQVTGGNGDDWLYGYGVPPKGTSPFAAAYLAESDKADTLDGGNGNDHLWGGGGYDVLRGGKGNDHLDGGMGKDTMTGGAGADVFSFGTLSAQAKVPHFDQDDVITDFQDGVDRLDISAQAKIYGPAIYLGQGQFVDSTHLQVRWEVQGDHTRVEAYVPIFTSPVTPVHGNTWIDLAGAHALSAGDFILS